MRVKTLARKPDVSKLVKTIRKTRGLTQEQLAHALGVTFSTVNAWENGRHRPIPALVAILQRMGERVREPRPVERSKRTRRAGRPE